MVSIPAVLPGMSKLQGIMMKNPETILLASGNRHKIVELESMLKPLEIRLVSTLDFPGTDEVDEDQPTLEGNALKKALFWHKKTGLSALADDTGLEVQALNGDPGVLSARYAGSGATYQDNVEKLLRNLDGEKARSARFRTVIVLAGKDEKFYEGVCEGEILTSARGDKGFGYDPVFKPAGYDKSFAELSPEEKNRISHRGRALGKLIEDLGR